MAIGVDWKGRRQILVVKIAGRDRTTSWREQLLSWKPRGWSGGPPGHLPACRAGCLRQEYGGAKEETIKRLKVLEKENGQFKKPVAELSLDKAMLKELVEGTEHREIAC